MTGMVREFYGGRRRMERGERIDEAGRLQSDESLVLRARSSPADCGYIKITMGGLPGDIKFELGADIVHVGMPRLFLGVT